MQLQTIANSNNLTMSSIEIAGLLESRHDAVKRSIDRLVQKNVIVQPPSVAEQTVDSFGRKRSNQVYVFSGEKGRRDSIVIVAQLCPEFTARLVDRWQELEAKEQKNQIVLPNFTDPIEAATAWIEQYKEKQVALQLLEVAKPKVSHYDNYVESSSLKTVTNAAKEMKLTSNVLWDWLRKEGHAFKNEKKNIWTKGFIEKGYGEMKQFTRKDNGYSGTQPYLTSTGDLFIKQNFTK